MDKGLYTEDAIFKAAYWFTDRYYLFLDATSDGKVIVEIRGKSSLAPDVLKATILDFCNSLVDFRVREQVMKQTSSVRDALILRAFGEGSPWPDLPGVKSNENRLVK